MHGIGECYSLDSPTLGIVTLEDQHKVPLTIPRDAIVKVIGEINTDGFVDVLWDGQAVVIFTQDLLARGVRVDANAY